MRRIRFSVGGIEHLHIDIWLSMLSLCLYGLIMVFSASAYQCSFSSKYNYNQYYLLQRQALYVALGIVVCLMFQFIHYSILYRLAIPIYIFSIGCIFLLLTSFGVSVNGATRWLNIGGIRFQVAEITKIGVIIGLAYMVKRYYKSLHNVKLLLYMWAMGGVGAALLIGISNDLSSSIVVLGITFGITFIYTYQMKIHLLTIAIGGSGISLYVLHVWRNMPSLSDLSGMSFRIGRIAAWLAPEKYQSDISYQTLQALYAIGRGGVWGQGLGQSLQKLSALPEAQNDMIFAIVCEELGIVGATILIGLFLYLFYCLYKAAVNSTEVFGSVLAVGTLLHVSIQTLINISVNLNLIPNTGITLPFISYGGTAVFCQLAEMAMVLSVIRTSNNLKVIQIHKKKEKKHANRKSHNKIL